LTRRKKEERKKKERRKKEERKKKERRKAREVPRAETTVTHWLLLLNDISYWST